MSSPSPLIRQLIDLSRLEDLSIREIDESVGYSVGTLHRWHRNQGNMSAQGLVDYANYFHHDVVLAPQDNRAIFIPKFLPVRTPE